MVCKESATVAQQRSGTQKRKGGCCTCFMCWILTILAAEMFVGDHFFSTESVFSYNDSTPVFPFGTVFSNTMCGLPLLELKCASQELRWNQSKLAFAYIRRLRVYRPRLRWRRRLERWRQRLWIGMGFQGFWGVEEEIMGRHRRLEAKEASALELNVCRLNQQLCVLLFFAALQCEGL